MTKPRLSRPAAAIRDALDHLRQIRGSNPQVAAFLDTAFYQQSTSKDKPPTGKCNCPRTFHQPEDTATVAQRWTCLNCWNHWWESSGAEVDGPPFQPYAEVLARAGSLEQIPLERLAREARSRNTRTNDVSQFEWWKLPQHNPLAGAEPRSRALPYVGYHDVALDANEGHLEQLFSLSFAAGRPQALFDFVYLVPSALEADWISREISKWRRGDSCPQHKANLKQLCREMTDTRGKRADPWNRIRSDLQVLTYIADNAEPKLVAAIVEAAAKFAVSEAAAKKIWTEYRPFLDSVVPTWFPTGGAAGRWLTSLIP